MRLVIVTGMSGAGKTAALKMLEDMGFYCVDNLPIPLVGKFAELVQSSSGEVSCAALGIDVRSGDELAQLESSTGVILAGSPTQKVSGEILEELTEVRHTRPMLSAGKVSRRVPRAGEGRAPEFFGRRETC